MRRFAFGVQSAALALRGFAGRMERGGSRIEPDDGTAADRQGFLRRIARHSLVLPAIFFPWLHSGCCELIWLVKSASR